MIDIVPPAYRLVMSQFSPEVTEKLLLVGGGAVSLDHMSVLGGRSTVQPSLSVLGGGSTVQPGVDCTGRWVYRATWCRLYWEVGLPCNLV